MHKKLETLKQDLESFGYEVTHEDREQGETLHFTMSNPKWWGTTISGFVNLYNWNRGSKGRVRYYLSARSVGYEFHLKRKHETKRWFLFWAETQAANVQRELRIVKEQAAES